MHLTGDLQLAVLRLDVRINYLVAIFKLVSVMCEMRGVVLIMSAV
jgi:hypothetical protein